jgi:hypothetical protein
MRTASRLVLVCVFAFAAVLAGCAGPLKSPPGTTTTVILIRHAERLHLSDDLNDDGRIRAAALPAAVADLDIAAIYSPNLQRNLNTIGPLAEQRGIEIVIADPMAVPERMIAERAGQVVLWVGNTTNLGNIMGRLGGEGEPPNTYGDIYILTIPDKGPTTIAKRHFGR